MPRFVRAMPPVMGPDGRPMPGPRRGVFVHRIPRNPSAQSPHNAVPSHSDNDDDNEHERKQRQRAPMELKQADYADVSNLDGDGDHDAVHSTNVIRWKLKRKKLQKWIRCGPRYGCYYSKEYELNNGSIWRLFIYPHGINQNGYQQDCVLFVALDELPYGVASMDVEFRLRFPACSVDFKFRKHFTPIIRSTGWPRGKLLSQTILDLADDGKKWVTLSCELVVHSVTFKGEPCSNFNYLRFKHEHPASVFALKHYLKPNGTRFRWRLSKTELAQFKSMHFKQCMVSRKFRVKWFKWYLQLYPNGLTQSGYVQPYLHCMKMPQSVTKIDAAFSFFVHETNAGYYHVDSFNGKLGKGWPERRLQRDGFVKWDELKSITIDCRVNILSIGVKAEQYFGGDRQDPLPVAVANGNSPSSESKSNEIEAEGNEDQVAPAAVHAAVDMSSMDPHGGGGDEEKEDPQDVADRAQFEKWLKEEVGLGQYLEMFTKNEIHSLDDVVEYIEEKSHLGEIGIKAFAHKAKMWKAILKLKECHQRDRDDAFIESSGTAFEF